MFLVLAGVLMMGGTTRADSLDHALGKALFDRIWTSSPASTDATDGLGPLFNARSCATCHPGGGRGTFEESKDGRITGAGLVLRLGNEMGNGDSVYGIQLQTLAVQGLEAEGKLWRTSNGRLVPQDLTLGPLDQKTRFSGRLAPDLRGLGLLQVVPEDVILAWADSGDRNQDGISGRANMVTRLDGEVRLGRFGWKAGKASILDQSAAALSADLGLSTPLLPPHWGDCTASQSSCLNAPHGDSERFDGQEVSREMLRLIAVYISGLPSRTPSASPKGLAVFEDVGCVACHRPKLTTGRGDEVHAYTDLLLHDMGAALADGIKDGDATGREWRTAPLWGLGSATRFLHDGRASNIDAAILLHGGEASKTTERYEGLSRDDRTALLKFLSSL